MSAGGAERRILRTLAALFGVAALAFTALSAGTIAAQWTATPAPWAAAALLACTAPGAALAAATRRAAVPVLRGLATVAAVASFAVTATAPLVLVPAGLGDAAPWPLGLTVIGTTAAALTGRPAAAWTATAVAAVLVATGRALALPDPDPLLVLQDAGSALFLDALLVALVLAALQAGRRVDEAEAAATRSAVGAAVERVRQDERARVDALVHDRVLATLLSAGRGPEDERGVQAQAAGALRDLRAMADGAPAAPRDGGDLAGRLRAVVTALAPAADLDETGPGAAPAVPDDVVDALLSAVGEALRNVGRHAADADVAVRLDVRDGAIEIVVVDDGPGFEPAAVPAARFGIGSSIVGRVRAVGGAAEVRSRPGHGTAVRITWPA